MFVSNWFRDNMSVVQNLHHSIHSCNKFQLIIVVLTRKRKSVKFGTLNATPLHF